MLRAHSVICYVEQRPTLHDEVCAKRFPIAEEKNLAVWFKSGTQFCLEANKIVNNREAQDTEGTDLPPTPELNPTEFCYKAGPRLCDLR